MEIDFIFFPHILYLPQFQLEMEQSDNRHVVSG